jgi:hypothetical protein
VAYGFGTSPSPFLRAFLFATQKEISVFLNNEKVRLKWSRVLLSFHGVFPEAVETSNFHLVVEKEAPRLNHMELGTCEGEFFSSSMDHTLAPAVSAVPDC